MLFSGALILSYLLSGDFLELNLFEKRLNVARMATLLDQYLLNFVHIEIYEIGFNKANIFNLNL